MGKAIIDQKFEEITGAVQPKTIVETLQAVQSELKAPKSQRNDFGKYNYRNCEDILEALKPILKKYDSAVVITDEIVQVGDRFYIKAIAKIMSSDGVIEVSAFAREPLERKGMDASQISGATSSYARKYALNGLFLIDDSRDPDATNNGNGTHDVVAKLSKDQLGQIRDLLIAIGDESKEASFSKFLGADSLENVNADKFNTAVTTLEAKKSKVNLAKAAK
jgi:hypothetical protein